MFLEVVLSEKVFVVKEVWYPLVLESIACGC